MFDRLYAWHLFDASRLSPTGKQVRQPTSADGVEVFYVDGGTSRDGRYGASTDLLQSQLASAVANPSTRAIAIHFNSGGGMAAGTFDAATAIASAARVKPTFAYVEDMCASAAFWLASQCRQIIAGPSSFVGSIGTFSLVVDDSEAWKALGVRIHLIATGEYKGAGAPGQPVTPEQLADTRRVVESLNAQFLSAVASGRRMSPDKVAQLADGRIHIASEAKQLGLIDGIGSFDQLLAGINKSHPARQASTATQIFNSLVAHEVSRGLKKSQAIPRVVAANPALHRAYLAEANAGR